MKRWIIFVIIFVLLFESLISIAFPKSGRVVDAVTNEPLRDVLITRWLSVGGGGHGSFSGATIVREEQIRTDEDGSFKFGFLVGFFPKFPFFARQIDKVLINYDTSKALGEYCGDIPENKTHFPAQYEEKRNVPFYSYRPYLSDDISFADIKLIPIVSEVEQCKDNEDCIEKYRREKEFCSSEAVNNCSFCKLFYKN